jgi:hypothetical protein
MSPDIDAIRDGLALIEATHYRDGEAVRVLLEHGDTRTMARFLATVCEGLISDLAEWNRLEPAAVLARLREWGGGHDD